EVGLHVVADLVVTQFFGGARHAVAGIVDHDVGTADAGQGRADHRRQILPVGHVDDAGVGTAGGQGLEIRGLFRAAQGAQNRVTTGQGKFGEGAAKAAGNTGD